MDCEGVSVQWILRMSLSHGLGGGLCPVAIPGLIVRSLSKGNKEVSVLWIVRISLSRGDEDSVPRIVMMALSQGSDRGLCTLDSEGVSVPWLMR